MAILFRVNPSDPMPLYHQLARQVRDAVASGKLKQGEKLPSHRELSRDLVINHLTVKQAYDTLEAEGILRTERGRGTFVAHGGDNSLRGQAEVNLRGTARELVVAAQLVGLSRSELVRLVREAWETESAPVGGKR